MQHSLPQDEAFFIQRFESSKVRTNVIEQIEKFRMGPFINPSQALTAVQAIRRTLLANLKSTGIIGVKIPNIHHEFSTIPGVREDALELILNLQLLVFKGYCEENFVGKLVFQGPGVVTASSIQGLKPEIECISEKQYVATVETPTLFEVDVLFTTSVGVLEDIPGSYLPVRTVFAPVRDVNYFLEKEDSQSPDYVILEIQTNGSITPLNAFKNSLENLQALLKVFETEPINLFQDQVGPSLQPKKNKLLPKEDSVVLEKTSIEQLNLSFRTFSCLRRNNVTSIRELMSHSKKDLLKFKNFGRKSLEEVTGKLEEKFGYLLE